MTADWMEESNATAPTWQNPHQRTYYRESVPPNNPSFISQSNPNSNVQYPNSFTGLSKELEEKNRRLQNSLDKHLGPEYVANRPGGGGTKLTYLEGWRAINLANEVFGFNGWYTDIKYLDIDFIDFNPDSQRYSMGVTAIVRVRLQDGASHEDVGYGKLENTKSKADGLDKCKKEAVTDALKRALRHFGKLLGNCLYDKQYLTQLASMKAKKPKFDWSTLYDPNIHAHHAENPCPLPTTRPPPPGIDVEALKSMPPPPVPTTKPPQHPPHMNAGIAPPQPQRAQTVGGARPNGSVPVQNSSSKQVNHPNSSKPPVPQRSTTVSNPPHASKIAPQQAQQQQSKPDPSDRSGAVSVATTDYPLGSDDDSFLANMDLDGTNNSIDEHGYRTMLLPSEGEESGTGRVYMEGDDSGFAESSMLVDVKESPSARPTNNVPPANGRHPPQPPTRQTTSSSPTDHSKLVAHNATDGKAAAKLQAEANKMAALARLEQNRKAKEAAAQHDQRHVNGNDSNVGSDQGGGGGGAGTTSAAQMLKGQNTTTTHGNAPSAIPPVVARPKLRPNVPPARANSLGAKQVSPPPLPQHHQQSVTGTGGGGPPRQAGTLPTLNVGNGIVQAQGQVGDSGFVSARGVKRGIGEGYDPQHQHQQGLTRAHTVSNPSTTRAPLGELDIGEEGQVKRYRASS